MPSPIPPHRTTRSARGSSPRRGPAERPETGGSGSDYRPPPSRRRLFCALALSLLLHAAALAARPLLHIFSPPEKKTPPPLLVALRPPPETPPAAPPPPPEPLIKDTLSEKEERRPAPEPEPLPPPRPPPKPAERELRQHKKKTEQRLRQKLHALDFYPEEAIERNLEGDVMLILSFDAAGRLSEVMLATGSGHRILDSAAQRAVRASAANFADPAMAGQEILFTVYFRLQ